MITSSFLFKFFAKIMSSILKLSTTLLRNRKPHNLLAIKHCATNRHDEKNSTPKFETVFSFPTVAYIALINKLKIYQIAATSLVVPGAGVLEMMNIVASGTFPAACYVGMGTSLFFVLNTFYILI